MTEGKWFLVYDDYDAMESWGHEHMPGCHLPLEASDVDSARAEAIERWASLVAKGRTHWGVFYPRAPRLAYEEPLPEVRVEE